MTDREHFWRLGHLSDRQLLERLQGVLRTQRCALAELIAHLGEVEERRLHLAAAHGSLFSYCVGQLGMSEDEACRRIELARLARRFSLLFGELASGRISLSVALLLKPVLTPDNHAELIAAARGASLRTARELLAARFPSPDVPSRIRKLPERLGANTRAAAVASVAQALPAASADAHAIPAPIAATARAIPAAIAGVVNTMPAAAGGVANAMPAAVADVVPVRVAGPGGTVGASTALALSSFQAPPRPPELELRSPAGVRAPSSFRDAPTPAEPSSSPAHAGLSGHADPRQRIVPRQRIDPLSAERYRVQFTADASLKQKLELARDLLRHSNPSGDLGPIVSRALDLLLAELLQRRFGVRRKETSCRAARTASQAAPATAAPAAAERPSATPQSSTLPVAVPAPARLLAAPSLTTPLTTTSGSSTRAVAVTVPAPARVLAAQSMKASLATTPRSSTPAVAVTVSAPARLLAAPSLTTPPATARGSSTPPVAVPAPAAPSMKPARATSARASVAASRIARAARRAVLERDGLGCCWVDAAGNRCGSSAWLEFDHRHPAGKRGSSEPDNLRLLCRSHNRFAAERAYGRDHVEGAIRARQRSAKRRYQSGQSPSSPARA